MKILPAPCLALAVLWGLTAPAVRAQTIHTRDGQNVAAQGVRRDGDAVVARIQTPGGSPGDIGYPVANIARIDFPEPSQIKLAGDLLNAGRADEAVKLLTPILAYYTPFRDVPGNWWTPLALLQADADARTGHEREANLLINDLLHQGGISPDAVRDIKIKQAAANERQGDHRHALDLLEPILKDQTVPPEALTEAWLTVGQARLAQRDFRPALLAFLHVPVYTPGKALLMAPALLGSANAYLGLEDGQRAQAALNELIAAYPNSPEAARAKERLKTPSGPVGRPPGS